MPSDTISMRVPKTLVSVKMTTSKWLRTLVPLVADLPQDVPEAERYRRLLHAVRKLFPLMQWPLLRLDGDILLPLATEGLSSDILGRRFQVAEHPAFRLYSLQGRPNALMQTAPCQIRTTVYSKGCTTTWKFTTAWGVSCRSRASLGAADLGRP